MEAKQLSKQEYIQLVHNFEESPNQWEFLGKRPALIDIYASWCGPCQRLSPILDQLAEKYAGKIDIYKVDVDTDRAVPRAYKIKSVPTLIFAPLNADRQMMHGDMTMAQLSEAIENILLNQQ
jgi:thioredoxin